MAWSTRARWSRCSPTTSAARSGAVPTPARNASALLERAADTVAVPEIEGIKIRQERRERERRRTLYAGETVTVDVVTGASSDVDRRLDECVAAVRRARSGSRHPTFKSSLARARALCDRHGIEWGPVLNQLRRAYEATLTEAEIRQREKGSINGLPDWIDRRAS